MERSTDALLTRLQGDQARLGVTKETERDDLEAAERFVALVVEEERRGVPGRGLGGRRQPLVATGLAVLDMLQELRGGRGREGQEGEGEGQHLVDLRAYLERSARGGLPSTDNLRALVQASIGGGGGGVLPAPFPPLPASAPAAQAEAAASSASAAAAASSAALLAAATRRAEELSAEVAHVRALLADREETIADLRARAGRGGGVPAAQAAAGSTAAAAAAAAAAPSSGAGAGAAAAPSVESGGGGGGGGEADDTDEVFLRRMRGEPGALAGLDEDQLLDLHVQLLRTLKAVADRLTAVRAETEAERMCVVCLCRPRDTLLMPCRHWCVCADDAKRLETCPVCRAKVTDRCRLFR
jgi:pyruvate/2-oxoglutarate dehydrogenase complex dihydrolipoamide acyltransferase (E2) component